MKRECISIAQSTRLTSLTWWVLKICEWDARLTELSASFLDEEDEGTLEEGWASTDNGEVWVWISKDTTARSNPSGYALYFKQEDNEWVFFGSCEIL